MGGKLQGAERWCPTILSTLVVTYLVILIKEFCGERSLWTAGDCSGISSALFGRNLRSDENEDLSHVLVLLFMFFGLSLGILVMQTLSHVGEAIPYTVLVFLMGIVFAAISDKSEGPFFESIQRWLNMDADLMLFVFLPPLVFGEAMNLNWYHVTRGFWQSVILAGPGVWIGAAIMGSITKVLLPYNWSWVLCFVFGSIMAATDTVAVVSLLHSVGATPKLTILVVGESLINDGSAMALFTLFFQALQGQTYTVGSVISFCIATVFGSVLLGIGFGLVCVRWLRSANNPLEERDITTQIAITFCCAYLSFFTAQYALDLSGVLSCCASGAVFACLAPRIILQHESMHNVWSIVEWGLNTMIFLLGGLMIGHRVLAEVNGMDWLYMMVLYVALVAARFVTMLILFPVISKIGHGCSLKEVCFMSWAGLRGALGMALALIVHKQMYGESSEMNKETSRLLFYVGGISALTLLINATTSKSVLFGLGLLSTNSAEKQLVTNQVKKKLRKKMNQVIGQLTKELNLRTHDLDTVRDACSLLHDMDMDKLYRESEALMAQHQLALHRPVADVAAAPGDTEAGAIPPPRSATFFATVPLDSSPPPSSASSMISSSAGSLLSSLSWKNGNQTDGRAGTSLASSYTSHGRTEPVQPSSVSTLGISPSVYGAASSSLGSQQQHLMQTPSSYDSTGVRGMIGRLRRDSTGGASASSQTRLQTVNEDDHHLFDDGTARPVRQVFSQAKRRADTGHGDDDDDDGGASLATDGTPSTANTANILAKSHRLSSKRKSKRGSVRSDRSHSKHASMGHLSGSFYLSGNHLSAKIEASEASRLDYFSRLVSIGNRDSRTILDEDLLAYIRSIFLEIVRVKYWHLIEVGKLPRISHSAQYLLYTIDVSLDDVQNVRDEAKAAILAKTTNKKSSISGRALAAGKTSARYICADWRCLQEDLDSRPMMVKAGEWWEVMTTSVADACNFSAMRDDGRYGRQASGSGRGRDASGRRLGNINSASAARVEDSSRGCSSWCSNLPLQGGVSAWLDKDEARRDKRAVYMLTAFMEAHEHAQKKLHNFLSGLVDDHHHHDGVGDYQAPPAPPDSPASPTDHDGNGTVSSEQLTATPEETKVLAESKDAVMRARKRLNEIPKAIVQDIRSRQVSRMVLAKESELVKNMVDEGLLASSHAAIFMEEIQSDIRVIEDDRRQFYQARNHATPDHPQHKHASKKASKRMQERPSEMYRSERHQSMRRKMIQSWRKQKEHGDEMQLLGADDDGNDDDDVEDDQEDHADGDDDDGMVFGAMDEGHPHDGGGADEERGGMHSRSSAGSSSNNDFETDHAALLASILAPEDSGGRPLRNSPWDAIKRRSSGTQRSSANLSHHQSFNNAPPQRRQPSYDSASSVSMSWSQHYAQDAQLQRPGPSAARRVSYATAAEEEKGDDTILYYHDDEQDDDEEDDDRYPLRPRHYSGFGDDDD